MIFHSHVWVLWSLSVTNWVCAEVKGSGLHYICSGIATDKQVKCEQKRRASFNTPLHAETPDWLFSHLQTPDF